MKKAAILIAFISLLLCVAYVAASEQEAKAYSSLDNRSAGPKVYKTNVSQSTILNASSQSSAMSSPSASSPKGGVKQTHDGSVLGNISPSISPASPQSTSGAQSSRASSPEGDNSASNNPSSSSTVPQGSPMESSSNAPASASAASQGVSEGETSDQQTKLPSQEKQSQEKQSASAGSQSGSQAISPSSPIIQKNEPQEPKAAVAMQDTKESRDAATKEPKESIIVRIAKLFGFMRR